MSFGINLIYKSLFNGVYDCSCLFGLSIEFEDLSLIVVKNEVDFIDIGGVFVKDWIVLLIFVLNLLNFEVNLFKKLVDGFFLIMVLLM